MRVNSGNIQKDKLLKLPARITKNTPADAWLIKYSTKHSSANQVRKPCSQLFWTTLGCWGLIADPQWKGGFCFLVRYFIFLQTQAKTFSFISCNLTPSSLVITDFLVNSWCTEIKPKNPECNKYTLMFLYFHLWTHVFEAANAQGDLLPWSTKCN